MFFIFFILKFILLNVLGLFFFIMICYNYNKIGGIMEKVNLWDDKKYLIVENDIHNIANLLRENSIYYEKIEIRNVFKPGDKIENRLDAEYSLKNKIVNYTDSEHNFVIYSGILFINPTFYNKYKKELENIFSELIINRYKDLSDIYIHKNFFSNELFEHLLTLKNKTINFENLDLTNEQINRLRGSGIDAYLNKEQISSKYVFSYYTIDKLKETDKIHVFYEDLIEQDINNLVHLPDNALINLLRYSFSNLNDDSTNQIIVQKLLELDKLGKPFFIQLDVIKRSVFNRLFKDINFKNLKLIVHTDLYNYSYEDYLEEEKKLEALVAHIKNSNLSPFEKYLAVYNIVKNYKEYKENNDNKDESRCLRYILDNEYMVCVGYSKLLVELLDKVGIDAYEIGVDVDRSYVKGFTIEEIPVDLRGHSRVVVSMDDDKYNIHGLYISDPTWDNNLQENNLNHSLMLFDKMQVSDRMFAYNYNEIILDIHNFKEFNEQVNFLIRRHIERSNYEKKTYSEILLDSYLIICRRIVDSIRCDPKAREFHVLLNNCKTISDYENFLTKIGNYLVTRINNKIPDKTILKASFESSKVSNKSFFKKITQISRYLYTKHDNYKRDLEFFPYKISKEEHNLEERKR